MKTVAVIPVKRFADAKHRLASALEPAWRAALAAAMVDDVLDAIAASSAVSGLIVVSGEPTMQGVARARGALLIEDDDTGHSEAAARGAERAIGLGAEAVAMLPGDCPLLDPAELDDALARLSPRSAAIVPDRHGTGTNALLLAPPDAIAPAFGPDSRRRHEALARDAGLEATVEPLASLGLDLDTPEDLEALDVELQHNPSRAPRTAAVLGEPGPARGA
jgi:2-phospho-L-lactate guanylyltransferase